MDFKFYKKKKININRYVILYHNFIWLFDVFLSLQHTVKINLKIYIDFGLPIKSVLLASCLFTNNAQIDRNLYNLYKIKIKFRNYNSKVY